MLTNVLKISIPNALISIHVYFSIVLVVQVVCRHLRYLYIDGSPTTA